MPLTASTSLNFLCKSRTSMTAGRCGAEAGSILGFGGFSPIVVHWRSVLRCVAESVCVFWGDREMYKVYGMSASGNCHKVRMVLEALRLPYSWTEIDPGRGQTRTPEFLAMNPNGKVPVLELEPGVWMSESNAIMFYLADGSTLVPSDRMQRARALEWM